MMEAVSIAIRFAECLDPAVISFKEGVSSARIFVSLPTAFHCFRPDMQEADAFRHIAKAIIHHEHAMPAQGFNYTVGSIFSKLSAIHENGGIAFIDQFINECIVRNNPYMIGRVFGIYGSAVPNVYTQEIVPYLLSRPDIDNLLNGIQAKDELGNFCIKHGIDTIHRHLPNKYKGKFLDESLGL